MGCVTRYCQQIFSFEQSGCYINGFSAGDSDYGDGTQAGGSSNRCNGIL
jgi:hypothetical protein